MAVTREEVAKLYVATFNRAPDASGLDYWVNTSFGGNPTIEQIAQSFFDQAETQTLYPANTSNSSFVASIYLNTFGRTADSDGLAYWIGELENGMTRSVMIEAMKNGALGDDAVLIANKAQVALAYADAGLEDSDFSLASVTTDEATVTTALNSVETLKEIADVAAYETALTAYEAAIVTAEASKLAAQEAAKTVSTVALSNASLSAANKANTDAQAVLNAANALKEAAAQTDDTSDDTLASSYVSIATSSLSITSSYVTTAKSALSVAQAAEDAASTSSKLLTTSLDQLTGTSSDDVFTGSNMGGTGDTINFGDTIAGSTGSDTLKLYISDDTNLGDLTLNSVETVWISNQDNSTDINAQEWTGTTSIEFYKPTVATKVSNLQNNVTITITEQATTVGLDVDFLSTAFDDGATLSLVLNDTDSSSDGLTTADGVLKVNTISDSFASLNITSNGTANDLTLDLDDGADVTDTLTTITVTGSADLALAENNDELESLTTVIASTMTGGLTLDLSAGAQSAGTATSITVTTGSGDDVITTTANGDTVTTGAGDDVVVGGAGNDVISTGTGNDTITTGAGGSDDIDAGDGNDTIIVDNNVTSNDDIDAGVGTDTVSLNSAGFVAVAADSTLLASLKNFEKVMINNSYDDSGDDNTTDISKYGVNYLTLAVDAAASQTVSGFTSGATVESTIDGNMANGLTIAITNATDLDNDSDTLNLVGNADLEVGDTHDLIYEITGIEVVTITTQDSTSTGEVTGVLPTAADGYTLNLDGNTTDGDARLETLNIVGAYSLNYTGTDSSDRLTTINASTSTGNIVINVSANDTKALTITTNTGADDITASDNGDTISTGAGDDKVTGGTGNDTIDGGLGDDDIDAGAGNDTVIIDTLTNTEDDDADGDAGSDTLKIYDAVVSTAGISANTIDLSDFDATKLSNTDVFDLYSTFENIDASLVTATTKSLKMVGEDGVDNTFIGGAAADTYTTGTGNDVIEIRSGFSVDGKEDYITDFTAGTDKLILSGSHGSSNINLESLTTNDNGDSDNNTFQYTDLGNVDLILHFDSNDLTDSIQLGRTYTEHLNDDNNTAVTRIEYFTTTGTTVTAGDFVDYIQAGSTTQTFKLGAGADVFLVGASDSIDGKEDTVTDLVAASDKIILTGSHSSNDIDLSALTVSADLGGGIYEYSDMGITDIKLNVNATDLQDTVQLGTTTAVFTSTGDITAGDFADVVQSGSGVQTIDLGDGDDILYYNSASSDASGVGESIDGGANADTIVVAGGTTAVNFSDDTITGFEVLELKKDYEGNNDNKNQSVTLTVAQLGALQVNTDNSNDTGDKITLSDALTANALDSTVINGDLKLVLANANNTLTLHNNTLTSGANDLYIDGSTLTGTNALTFDGNAEVEATLYITSGAGDDVITGGQNADRITLGSGADEINYTAAAEFGDTITDFSLSADMFDLDEAVTAAGYTEIVSSSAVDTGLHGVIIADYNIATAASDMTATELYDAIISSNANLGASEKAYFLVSANATSSADAFLFHATVNGGANGFSAINLVATLNGITDLTASTAGTFDGFA